MITVMISVYVYIYLQPTKFIPTFFFFFLHLSTMLSKEVVIDTPNGFKFFPVSKYIKTCRSIKACDITLSCNGKTVDSKSPAGLMDLALNNGDNVTLSVNGENEEKTLNLLVDLLQKVGK